MDKTMGRANLVNDIEIGLGICTVALQGTMLISNVVLGETVLKPNLKEGKVGAVPEGQLSFFGSIERGG